MFKEQIDIQWRIMAGQEKECYREISKGLPTLEVSPLLYKLCYKKGDAGPHPHAVSDLSRLSAIFY